MEVHVAAGLRSQRLIEWLREQGSASGSATESAGGPEGGSEGTIRYAAVDPFEAGGPGHTGLREFHSRLGRLGVRPLPVPIAGSLAASLTRVAHTIGAVDLLILDCSAAELSDPAVLRILPRLVHADSVVLSRAETTGELELQPASRYIEPLQNDRRAA